MGELTCTAEDVVDLDCTVEAVVVDCTVADTVDFDCTVDTLEDC